MKKIIISIVLSFSFFGSSIAQNKLLTLSERWAKIESLEKKQLPESILKEVEIILNQATEENKPDEEIKAMVYKMRFTIEKNGDKSTEMLKQFEVFAKKFNKPADQALLHSMIAELYAQYFLSNRWVIKSRTDINDSVPEDIKEWTKDTFMRKILEELNLSLLHQESLQSTKPDVFSAMIKKSPDSQLIEPSLYDFLANRKISILNEINDNDQEFIENKQLYFDDFNKFMLQKYDTTLDKKQIEIFVTYQNLLTHYNRVRNVEALIFTDLQRLEYYHNKVTDSDSLYEKSLLQIEKQYQKLDFSVEILADLAGLYLEYDNDSEVLDKQTKISLQKLYTRKAYNLCEKGIKNFPNYKRIGLLKNIENQITQSSIKIENNDVVALNKPLKINITTKNLAQLELKVYKLNISAIEFNKNGRNIDNLKNKTLVESRIVNCKTDPDFCETQMTIIYQPKEYGIYQYTLDNPNNHTKEIETVATFTVTDLSLIRKPKDSGNQQVYVLNRITGKPVRNVQIDIWKNEWKNDKYQLDSLATYKTDVNGYANIDLKEPKNYMFRVKYGNDCFYVTNEYVNYYHNEYNSQETKQIEIFTDRAIYRPGQIVYFKAIAYTLGKETAVTARKELKVDLYDANYQIISTKNMIANEFGSVAGSFVLPQNGLNGYYRIQSDNFSYSFKVEEYKRPTFEVKIEQPKDQIKFGENIILKGLVIAYSGNKIANATVKYTIKRRMHPFCWWYHIPEKKISSGTVITRADGSFDINFIPKLESINNNKGQQAYSYSIEANVTDTKGETQTGLLDVSVSQQALFINTEISNFIDKDQFNGFNITVNNINGNKITSKVKYKLIRLLESDDYEEELHDEHIYDLDEVVYSGELSTDQPKLNLDLKTQKSARYKLLLTTVDKNGEVITLEKIFILYTLADKRPPVKRYVWIPQQRLFCKENEVAHIKFGTSSENAYVLYEIMKGNSVLYSKWIQMSDQIECFDVPWESRFEDGVNVHFTFMKNERLFCEEIKILKKPENKKLNPKWSVFRDKLQPGEKCTWSISIPECRMTKKQAELMIDMYDASLDVFGQNYFHFNPIYSNYQYSSNWEYKAIEKNSDNKIYPLKLHTTIDLEVSQLKWFNLNFYQNLRMQRNRMMKASNMASGAMQSVSFESSAKLPVADALQGMISGLDVGGDKELADHKKKSISESINAGVDNSSKLISVRTNFNETAFFYPQLQTDSLGDIKLSFTVPESLTKWNVKLLAHTKDLYFGTFDTTTITQKDLMIQMNLPRFIRQSDKLVLSANVVNLSGKVLEPKVQLELIDPATNKVIKSLSPQTVNNANKNTITKGNDIPTTNTYSWTIDDLSAYNLIICKVTADADNFSDGEQKYLPILPDKVLVTESQPIYVRNSESKKFTFESLKNNANKVETKNLSVEFASNPIWYAVQALPSIAEPEYKNAISLLSSYYANSMASYLANANPKILEMVNQWKNNPQNVNTLVSNLKKNTELKNILLDETPWVLNAKNETQQKQQIAEFFDVNNLKEKRKTLINQLMNLQTPSGAFSWFERMPGERYITLRILLNLGQLRATTHEDFDEPYKTNIKRAIIFVDNELDRDFKELKNNNKNYEKEICISDIQLFTLHVRSYFPETSYNKSVQDAVKYYTAQSEKYWTSCTLYGKAMMALVAQRNGNTKIATEIYNSLKENALKTDEMGMYWSRNTSGYFWFERPISIQASIIEAFKEMKISTKEIDELKIWLLRQKQTQTWDSPMSTVDAINALLNTGSDWFNNTNEPIIRIGNQTITAVSKETGTGYFKQSLDPNMVNATMSEINISTDKKPDKGSSVAWGAVYWQYLQDQKEVKGQGNNLKVSKSLFVKSDDGKTMTPISKTSIKVGDKVVTRLVVTSDRDMEYVVLKDMRAACFEPADQTSGYVWRDGAGYYQTSKDNSTHFFFSHLRKGTYVIEYELWTNNCGEFSSGIASLQCQYAPEFVSHSSGEKIQVTKQP